MFDSSVCVSVPPDLEEIPAGAELARVLGLLDYDRLSPHDLVRVMQAQRRQASHYEAGVLWSMDRLVTTFQNPAEDPDDFRDLEWAVGGACAEIAAALVLTRNSAEFEAGLAIQLNRRVPKVMSALLEGRIDMRRARVLVDGTLNVSAAAARVIVDEVIDDAAGLTTGQLRARLQKLCIDADPTAALARFGRAVLERRLVVEPNPSGTANLLLLEVAPHVAASIRRYVHKEAIKLKKLGDIRTMDQLRCDITTDLLRRRHRGKKVTRADFGMLEMRVTAETLTGASDDSAELGGFGPILGEIARQVAHNQEHTERRWTLIDPDTKQPIDGGITRRKPTAAQRRMVETLYPTCIHPGCRMPSVDCDIDHSKGWKETGITCNCHLGPLCRHHHVIKHKYGWTYELVDGGDILFTSPLGLQYHTSGRPVPVAQPP